MVGPLAVGFITLHAPDGRGVSINPEQITSLQHKNEKKNVAVNEKINCIINLSDGKFIGVIEDCDFVRGSIKP